MGSLADKAMNASLGRGWKTTKEIKRRKYEKSTEYKRNKMFREAMMPDEEVLRVEERKKAGFRRGSRASTILTDRETLG